MSTMYLMSVKICIFFFTLIRIKLVELMYWLHSAIHFQKSEMQKQMYHIRLIHFACFESYIFVVFFASKKVFQKLVSSKNCLQKQDY